MNRLRGIRQAFENDLRFVRDVLVCTAIVVAGIHYLTPETDSIESSDSGGMVEFRIDGETYRLTPTTARDVANGLIASAASAE